MSPHSAFFEKTLCIQTRWVDLLKDTEMHLTITENFHRDAFEIHWTRNWPASRLPRNLIFPGKQAFFEICHMDTPWTMHAKVVLWSSEAMKNSSKVITKTSNKHQQSSKKRRNRVITENAKTLIFLGKHESSQRFFSKKRLSYRHDESTSWKIQKCT